jgi:hypothetical protein
LSGLGVDVSVMGFRAMNEVRLAERESPFNRRCQPDSRTLQR